MLQCTNCIGLDLLNNILFFFLYLYFLPLNPGRHEAEYGPTETVKREKSEKYYSGNNIIQIIYKCTAQMKYKHLNIPKMHINTFIHTHRLYKNQNT